VPSNKIINSFHTSIDIPSDGVYISTMQRINVHVTEKQLKELRVLSKATGLTVAEALRRAIDDYLIRQHYLKVEARKK
jgi:hypothetical protein